MINDLSFFANDKQVAFAPQIHIGTKLLNGTVVHVYKKDPLYLMRFRIEQPFTQSDHPLIFSLNSILDMRSGDHRFSFCLHRILIPGHTSEIHIRIACIRSSVDEGPPVFFNYSNVADIRPGIHQRDKLLLDPFPHHDMLHPVKKIIGEFRIVRNNVHDIFHITDVGIDISVHLLHQLDRIGL